MTYVKGLTLLQYANRIPSYSYSYLLYPFLVILSISGFCHRNAVFGGGGALGTYGTTVLWDISSGRLSRSAWMHRPAGVLSSLALRFLSNVSLECERRGYSAFFHYLRPRGALTCQPVPLQLQKLQLGLRKVLHSIYP